MKQNIGLGHGACPNCGAVDNYTVTAELRGSFSWLSFLGGGMLAVFFRNASRPKRVRCNLCEALFDVQSAASKLSRVIYWLLVGPTIILLVFVAIKIIIYFM